MGFLGTSLPAEKGGVGGTFLDEAIVLEEQVENLPRYRCCVFMIIIKTKVSKISLLFSLIFI